MGDILPLLWFMEEWDRQSGMRVEEELGKRAKERGVVRAGCYCLLTETYLELSTVCNDLDVLLFNGGCSK